MKAIFKTKTQALTVIFGLLMTSLAFAKQYTPTLYIAVKLDCSTGKIFATDPAQPGYALLPNHTGFPANLEGNFDNQFSPDSYVLDQNGQVVLNKKKSVLDLFGRDSIMIGTPQVDVATSCKYANPNYPGLMGIWAPIKFADDVKFVEEIEWAGSCYKHSLEPNQNGFAYYKPFKQSLNFTSFSSKKSIRLENKGVADLGHSDNSSIEACEATNLP